MNAAVTIRLEDKGQDILWLRTDGRGVVVDAGPYQNRIWKGAYIPLEDVRKGRPCPIHHPPAINFGYLKYSVKSIENDRHDET